MKKTFLYHEKPMFTTMIQTEYPDYAIRVMEQAHSEGADAFGLQVCRLKPEFRKSEVYQDIFSHAGDKPMYVTNYRYGYNEGKSDEELADGLLELARSGATLCDVMGDLFCKDPDELTMDPIAIEKQKQLIEQLHKEGAEVLMSSHTYQFRSAERVLEIARQQQERGADIVKIVTGAENMEQQIENLRIVDLLKREIETPFIFLSQGQSNVLRRVGPMLGCCMYLCVLEHNELSTQAQPLLRRVKAIWDNFN